MLQRNLRLMCTSSVNTVCNDWRATYHERRTRPAARPAQA